LSKELISKFIYAVAHERHKVDLRRVASKKCNFPVLLQKTKTFEKISKNLSSIVKYRNIPDKLFMFQTEFEPASM